jgi:hypothetical protein
MGVVALIVGIIAREKFHRGNITVDPFPQTVRWNGGDNLPTSPLSCEARDEAEAPTRYNGGQPSNPPNLAGKEITIVDVPKLIGIAYFNATSKGIHVVGYDANSTPDAREWFVNQAEFNGIGKSMVDSMAKEIGEDGSFAIVTSTFTTPNHARWIAEMQAYAEKCHPKMTWLETVDAEEDNNHLLQPSDDAH